MAGFLEYIIENRREKVNNYLINLLERAKENCGENSSEYNGIYNQYFKMPILENSILKNRRHYEAEMVSSDLPRGLERLYKRSVVIDLLSSCAAECVYCLRGYYNKFVLSDNEISEIVKYCSLDENLKEVLITGGDPLISYQKLSKLILELAVRAPNIKIIRIGTRLPVQDPEKVDLAFFVLFNSLRTRFLIEIACQINHYYEIQEESRIVFKKLRESGCLIYAQNVLLKDVNDTKESLINLYDTLRYLGILPHYLFHAVPMLGTENFRTTVNRGLELINDLTCSGSLSGRAKPQFSLMTDIGKVTLYEGTIIDKKGEYLTVKTKYNIEDRLKWNPYYTLPESATICDDGFLSVQYQDGISL